MAVWCNDPEHEAARHATRSVICGHCGGAMRPTSTQTAWGLRYECSECGLNTPILTALRMEARYQGPCETCGGSQLSVSGHKIWCSGHILYRDNRDGTPCIVCGAPIRNGIGHDDDCMIGGECDVCAAPYQPSGTDHCGAEGVCWEHCTDPVGHDPFALAQELMA